MSAPASSALPGAKPFSAWERSIALRYLRARRKDSGLALVSIISFLGVAAAVGVLIIVMSVMNGFRSDLLGRMLGFNGHLFVQGQLLENPATRDPLVQRIRAVPGVVQAGPLIEAQAMVVGKGQITAAIVRGVNAEDLRRTQLIATNIKQGSLNAFGAGEYGGDGIVIGERMAAKLGVRPGDSLTLISPSGADTAFGSNPNSKDYTILGVFGVGMSQFDEGYIYMPLAQAQLFFGKEQAADLVEIKIRNPDRAGEMRDVIGRAAGPLGVVTDWTDQNSSFFGALQVERNVMRLILMLIVAIAALNIISGLVMLVKNKTRDIAILRTMGAPRQSILRIFFMSGAAVGVFGALAGLVFGILFCVFIHPIQELVEAVTGAKVFSADVYFLSHIPAKIDWGEVATVALFSFLMSFLATLWPAWRASRLDPVEALRYE